MMGRIVAIEKGCDANAVVVRAGPKGRSRMTGLSPGNAVVMGRRCGWVRGRMMSKYGALDALMGTPGSLLSRNKLLCRAARTRNKAARALGRET